MTMPSAPLGAAGPAQFHWLIHFCGRPPSTTPNWDVPPAIQQLSPDQKLHQILWEQHIYGFPPFQSYDPVVCLSESPLDHLNWLLRAGWPPWGVFVGRQTAYYLGGGPAWQVRSEDFAQLASNQRRWAVRLDTTPGRRSEWLHEREWRIPGPGIQLGSGVAVAVLLGDPQWTPARVEPHRTGMCLSSSGEQVLPGDPGAVADETIPIGILPPLWQQVLRLYWDPSDCTIKQAP